MEKQSSFSFFWGALVALATFVAPAFSQMYLNFYDDGLGNAYISQLKKPCDFDGLGTQEPCIAVELEELSATASVLDTLLKNHWFPVKQSDGRTNGNLYFASDIDLGQLKSENSCSVNHVPLTFKASYGRIFGFNKTISNMCYRFQVTYGQKKLQEMPTPAGFFNRLENVEVSDLDFTGAFIGIDDFDSTGEYTFDGHAFRPVGVLAGVAANTYVQGMNLKKVKMMGPIAGGVFGYVSNSVFERVKSEDSIVVFNQTTLNKAHTFAGSAVFPWGGRYAVFMGGLAGFALNLNIYDVHLKVQVQNDAEDTTAAIGGLVGLYAISQDSVLISDTVMVVEQSDVTASLYGGKAMGGYFGEVAHYYYKSNDHIDMSILKSSVRGTISDAKSDSVFEGGFIGRSQFDEGSSLKFIESHSEVKMDEKLNGFNRYAVYSGGFLGFGMCSTENSTPDALISFVQSTAEGDISVHVGDASNLPERVRANIGGFVGWACMAASDSAFFADTSSVKMKLTVESAEKQDSTFVGGFAGYVRNKKKGDAATGVVWVRRSEFTGKIEIVDESNRVYVGGAVGMFPDGFNNRSIGFNNIFVQSGKIIDVVAPYEIVGGVCGFCSTSSLVQNVAVQGDIRASLMGETQDSAFVGGLFGRLNVPSGQNFRLQNAYVLGNIGKSDLAALETSRFGYLVGDFMVKGRGMLHTIWSTYHFGDDLLDAFGSFYTEEDAKKYDWKDFPENCPATMEKIQSSSLCWIIRNNVRNGDDTKLTDKYNGIMLEADMKSRAFVDSLNHSLTEEEGVWTFDSLDVNGGFPYFSVQSDDIKKLEPEIDPPDTLPVPPDTTPVPPDTTPKIPPVEPVPPDTTPVPPDTTPEIPPVEPLPPDTTPVPPDTTPDFPPVEPLPPDTTPVDGRPHEDPRVVADSFETPSFSVSANRWQMVSLAGLKEKISRLTDADAVFWWDEARPMGDFWQYSEYDSQDEGAQTRGYWIWSDDSVGSAGSKLQVDSTLEIQWELDSLYSGWNLVANPYGWYVKLPEAELGENVWRWDPVAKDYVNPKVLMPYEGIWVKSDRRKTVKFSALPASAGEAPLLAKKVSSGVSATGWTLCATLTDEWGRRDSRNVFGVGPRSLRNEEPPSAMGDHVKFSFVEGRRSLAKSIKASHDVLEWNVVLKASSERVGYLSLDGVSGVNSLGKKVLVTIDGSTREVKPGQSLRVVLKAEAKPAVIRVVDADEVLDRPVLSGIALTRTEGVWNVSFNVSADFVGTPAQIDLVKVTGKVQLSLRRDVVAGMNAVALPKLDRGLYVIRVRVGSKTMVKNIAIR